MTEHKFTDEEVIKALECCIKTDHFGDCFWNDCPFVSEHGCKVGKETLYPYVLDLIKRQKAEIAYWMDEAANAKREAFKEFADRLKEKLIAGGIYPVLVKNSMDKLLKEMTGEKE
jgi:hypothetical protein